MGKILPRSNDGRAVRVGAQQLVHNSGLWSHLTVSTLISFILTIPSSEALLANLMQINNGTHMELTKNFSMGGEC